MKVRRTEGNLLRSAHMCGGDDRARDGYIVAAEVMAAGNDHGSGYVGAQRSTDRVLIVGAGHAEDLGSVQLAQLRRYRNGQIVFRSPKDRFGRGFEIDGPIESEESHDADARAVVR